jgi:ribonucleotide monophosphatase NagD (HAD superfamily)
LYLKYFNDNNIKLDYVVGDRVDTDIYLGNKLNSTSILVDSGVVNFASDKNADFKLNSFSEIESVVF